MSERSHHERVLLAFALNVRELRHTLGMIAQTLSESRVSQQRLVGLLADGRVTVESYLNQLSDVIALGDYDATLTPIERWWDELLHSVTDLDPMTAAQLGSSADLDPARRPSGATQGNMNLAPLRSFLEAGSQTRAFSLHWSTAVVETANDPGEDHAGS